MERVNSIISSYFVLLDGIGTLLHIDGLFREYVALYDTVRCLITRKNDRVCILEIRKVMRNKYKASFQYLYLFQVGKCVELVPYEPEHVPKYHEWMTDPHLRECTASEPLTLDEEYAMQISWREDPKKCTFIVLHRSSDDLESHTSQDAIDRMIGDVNLFFNDYEDSANCEIEIMIANESHRRQGCGREAVEIMMAFAVTRLNASRFYCKIHRNNKPSMKLFENLGYIQCNYVAAFEEYEYEFALKNNTIWKARIAQEIMQSTRVIIDSTILQEERTLKNAVTLVEAVD